MKRTVLVLATAAALSLPAVWQVAPAVAAGGSATPQLAAAPAAEVIYGSELMTQAERDAYLKKLAAAKTDADKDKIRQKHHDEMVALAKKKGVTIADPAPAQPAGDTTSY
jgi:hypothetical protein